MVAGIKFYGVTTVDKNSKMGHAMASTRFKHITVHTYIHDCGWCSLSMDHLHQYLHLHLNKFKKNIKKTSTNIKLQTNICEAFVYLYIVL